MGGPRQKHRLNPKKIAWAVAIGLASAAIAFALSSYRLFTIWELKTYDLRMQTLAASRPAPKDVVMFAVDEDSLRFMAGNGIGWPWPRELYASALDFCRRGGARAVLFDLFYSEDSTYGVADDAAFAAGVAAGPPSYFVLFLSRNEGRGDPREEEILKKSAVPLTPPAPAWMPVERSMQSLPIAPLIFVATGFGNAQVPPDVDGVYRRIALIEGLPGAAVPSIPLKVAADVARVPSLHWPMERRFFFGGTNVPLGDDGAMMIHYYGDVGTFPTYPLGRILAADAALAGGGSADIDPAVVKDKIVIIGVTAPGLYDMKPTPLARVYPGQEIHATVIENLLTGDFLAPVSTAGAVAITAAAGLVAALLLATIASSWGIGASLTALIALVLGAGFALFARGVWMPVVAPAGALACASFGMLLHNYLTEGRKKREIRRAFGQYLSPHVVAKISRDPASLALGGTLQEMTLFFSDIADFTTISEKTPPPELVARLNAYFSKTTRIIQARGGTLDKYIGDAIMAFWGAPLPMADHAAQAVLAALEIQEALAGGAFATRVGIHTGPSVVGNIGSDIRFNYTAIGDTVNLASRLEGLCKQFGTRIIISETTSRAAGDAVEARRIGKVRVKGRAEPIGIYEPLCPAGVVAKRHIPSLADFARALELFEAARFEEARSLFAQVANAVDDPTARVYEGVCERYQQEVPAGFDGVITFTTK